MFKRMAFTFGVVAIGASVSYLFVYLYRWEWNRAIMAGIFLIAAEIAFAAAAIFDRIKALEKSISRPNEDIPEIDTLARIRESAPASRNHFEWLDDAKHTSVFIPFLMGAGLVASALAWAIERMATATAKPAFERGLAARLAPISLPVGRAVPAATPLPTRNGKATLRRQAIALSLAILIGTVGIDVLGDATQTRPDVLRAGTTSEVTMELLIHGSGRGEASAIASLWAVCRGTVPNGLADSGITALGDSRYRILLEPALGKYGERRLHGCLEDATIDNVQGRVLSIST
jgi:hypothetical protein